LVFFESGRCGTHSYKRWGIYAGDDTIMNVFKASSWMDGVGGSHLAGNLTLLPENWYFAGLFVDRDSNFLAIIWDKDRPDRSVKYEASFSEDWVDKLWRFRLAANQGIIYIDEYAEVEFDEYNPYQSRLFSMNGNEVFK